MHTNTGTHPLPMRWVAGHREITLTASAEDADDMGRKMKPISEPKMQPSSLFQKFTLLMVNTLFLQGGGGCPHTGQKVPRSV